MPRCQSTKRDDSLVPWQDLWQFLRASGFDPHASLVGWVLPLLMTVVLFMGPLVLWAVDRKSDGGADCNVSIATMWKDPTTWRNLVFAPLTEEFLFRGLIVPVLQHGVSFL